MVPCIQVLRPTSGAPFLELDFLGTSTEWKAGLLALDLLPHLSLARGTANNRPEENQER